MLLRKILLLNSKVKKRSEARRSSGGLLASWGGEHPPFLFRANFFSGPQLFVVGCEKTRKTRETSAGGLQLKRRVGQGVYTLGLT